MSLTELLPNWLLSHTAAYFINTLTATSAAVAASDLEKKNKKLATRLISCTLRIKKGTAKYVLAGMKSKQLKVGLALHGSA